MALVPVAAGADQVSATWLSPGVPETPVGAPGGTWHGARLPMAALASRRPPPTASTSKDPMAIPEARWAASSSAGVRHGWAASCSTATAAAWGAAWDVP